MIFICYYKSSKQPLKKQPFLPSNFWRYKNNMAIKRSTLANGFGLNIRILNGVQNPNHLVHPTFFWPFEYPTRPVFRSPLYIILYLPSSSHMTRSMEGLDKTDRSELRFWDPTAGITGYTVNLQPQPFTDPSELNFHLISSPGARISADQSLQSRPDLMLMILPVPSMTVNGSCRRSVEHCLSNSTRRDSAPAIRTCPVWQASSTKKIKK